MGGLVAKKASNMILPGLFFNPYTIFLELLIDILPLHQTYLLARNNPQQQPIAHAIHGMVFLGTPHRGSESAITMDRILSCTVGKKAYVEDLKAESSIIEQINEDFRHHGEMKLVSCYETLETPLAGGLKVRVQTLY